ncbi:sulfotransferase [bacterium]|nr:sulfotransferase [bacterium]
MKCAFIVSPSYSGSTLLSILLAHHPDLVTLGEFLDNQARRFREGEGDFCSCGAKLDACPYMSDLSGRIHAKGIPFTVDYPDTAFLCGDGLPGKVLRAYVRGPLFEAARRLAIPLLPLARSTVARVVDRNTKVIASILEKENAKVYLDSAKNNNRVLYFHRYAPRMEVKVIWLIRDGRGVVTSIRRHANCDTATAIDKWVTTQTSVIRTVKYLPRANVLTMRYEDLCTRPGDALAEACRFLGLDPAQLPESYSAEGLHLTGNNMRLKGLGEIRIDERWKSALDDGDLALFAARAGALNRELGYGE